MTAYVPVVFDVDIKHAVRSGRQGIWIGERLAGRVQIH